ncbi:MAG: hypothetical protein V7682_00280 [Cycloclasticus sp.]
MAKKTNDKTLGDPSLSLELANVDIEHISKHVLSDNDTPDLRESNEFRSAGALMKSIADEVLSWRESLPEGFQPAIVAILQGGIQIDVLKLSQVSFHGIRIEGTMAGNACVMFAHQANIQMLCHAIKVKKAAPSRSIGFIWPDKTVHI